MKGNFMSLILFGKINSWPFTCALHLYNLNSILFSQWTEGIFQASPPFNFEILTVHCTGCIVSLDIACVFISFPNVFLCSLRIQSRKYWRTIEHPTQHKQRSNRLMQYPVTFLNEIWGWRGFPFKKKKTFTDTCCILFLNLSLCI